MGLAILLVALMRHIQLGIALVSLVGGVLRDCIGALPVVRDLGPRRCGPLLRTLVRRDRHGVVGHVALLAACLRGSTRAREWRSAGAASRYGKMVVEADRHLEALCAPGADLDQVAPSRGHHESRVEPAEAAAIGKGLRTARIP